MMNLAAMPHVLIAGANGRGEVELPQLDAYVDPHASTPDQVRMILVDPKRVEMGQHDRLPHLLTQVVTNPKKAANALAWAVKEMERRYDLLAEVGFRDITGYNAAVDRGDLDGDGWGTVSGYVDEDDDGGSDARSPAASTPGCRSSWWSSTSCPTS